MGPRPELYIIDIKQKILYTDSSILDGFSPFLNHISDGVCAIDCLEAYFVAEVIVGEVVQR
ncbi:hypothetical protein GGR91_001489, partial [Sphingorhabdus rigui]|nr:hypothetical protein [Sphingorhabdus rigui]